MNPTISEGDIVFYKSVSEVIDISLEGKIVVIRDPLNSEELLLKRVYSVSSKGIELRGDNVFKGYWQMPEKTAESFREDGFFITGDMARIDENGYVVIVGRDKALIITGGLNVYPKEVEDLIDEIDSVNESAVIAVPHSDFGEAVVSIVVRKKDSVNEQDIKAHLSERIAKFKQPKKIIFANNLPRNTMGKVQKSELRKKYQDLFNN